MTVDAGALRHRIQIIRRTETQDADGYSSVAETVVRSCWARVSRTSGTEAVRANADMAEIKIRFLIRYAAGLDRKMFVRYAGMDYEIVYLNDYEDRHQYIELWCQRDTREAVG